MKRSYKEIAERLWPDANAVGGQGVYALIRTCRGLTVSLREEGKTDRIKRQKTFIDEYKKTFTHSKERQRET